MAHVEHIFVGIPQVPFLVMALERGVVLPPESTGTQQKPDRHGRAKHRAALVLDQDVGLMEVEQPLFDGHVRIAEAGGHIEIGA